MLPADFVTMYMACQVAAPVKKVTHLVALGFALRQIGCVQRKKAPH